MIIHKLATLLTTLTIAVTITSCKQQQNTEEGDSTSAFLRTIETVKSEVSVKQEELTLAGKVECDPDRMVTYTPLAGGVVEKTYFALGDKVQKGQNMLDLRSSDLSSLQSELISAESEVRIAQRELRTAQSMFEDGMIAERELLEAEAKEKQAQASLSKAKADMSVFGTNKGSGVFTIKSPIAGFVIDKRISSGMPVAADSDPLFVVADLSSVWITASVYASNLQLVKEGMEVSVTTLSYPNEIFAGTIHTLSQTFDPEEKVLKARIIMRNTDMKFKPEMSVVITLKNSINRQVVAVPTSALVFDNNKHFVVVSKGADTFEVKEVELDGHLGTLTYLRSGLLGGEDIVTKNQLLVYSGLKQNS